MRVESRLVQLRRILEQQLLQRLGAFGGIRNALREYAVSVAEAVDLPPVGSRSVFLAVRDVADLVLRPGCAAVERSRFYDVHQRLSQSSGMVPSSSSSSSHAPTGSVTLSTTPRQTFSDSIQ